MNSGSRSKRELGNGSRHSVVAAPQMHPSRKHTHQGTLSHVEMIHKSLTCTPFLFHFVRGGILRKSCGHYMLRGSQRG